MLGLTGIVSVDYTKKGVPLVWNSSLGLMLGFGDASNTLVYSTGVNWLVNDYIQPLVMPATLSSRTCSGRAAPSR
jgi:hypothetical protein